MLQSYRARLRLALDVLQGNARTANGTAVRRLAGRLDRLAADLDDASTRRGRHPAAIADDIRRTAEDIRREVEQ